MATQGYVDYYNFLAMSMPLHEYIHQPLAYDIIHNGGTFQVARLTNNSYLEEEQETPTMCFNGIILKKVTKSST